MNAAHLHLMVNHLPLFAALFAALLLAVGLLRDQKAVVTTGLVLSMVAGLGAFLATQTGERAEGVIEDYPMVSESTIEEHEHAGEAALASAVALGLLALATLAIPPRMAGAKRAATIGTLAVALVAFGFVARAANLGGAIRHPEITDGGSVPLFEGSGEGGEIEH